MPVHPTDLIVRGPKHNVKNPEYAEKLVGIVHQAQRFSVQGQGEFLWRSWRSREVSQVVARMMGNAQPYCFLEPANPRRLQRLVRQYLFRRPSPGLPAGCGATLKVGVWAWLMV